MSFSKSFSFIIYTVWKFYHKMQEKKTQISIYYVIVSTGQESGSTLAGSSGLRLYLKPQWGFWAPWRRGALGRCMQVALGTHWLLVSNKNSSPCEHACLQLCMSFLQIKEYKRQWKSNPRQGPFFLTIHLKSSASHLLPYPILVHTCERSTLEHQIASVMSRDHLSHCIMSPHPLPCLGNLHLSPAKGAESLRVRSHIHLGFIWAPDTEVSIAKSSIYVGRIQAAKAMPPHGAGGSAFTDCRKASGDERRYSPEFWILAARS